MDVTHFEPRSGINAKAHRPEHNFRREIAAIDLDAGREIVTLRLYGTPARSYACVWISERKANIYANGSGMAGGYGYHRMSAAADTALRAAGVTLSEDIDGRGDDAMRAAVKAVALHLGASRVMIHEAHG